MNIDLTGRRALVAGSTAGIGEEVANMAVHVASERSSATTGTALRVDGGVVRAIP